MWKQFLYITIYIFGILSVFSCSRNNEDEATVIGKWELVKIEDSQIGPSLQPKDNKPVSIEFLKDGTYIGKAGNNNIEGEYSLEGDNIIFTLFTTEVPNTEWELSFKDAINKKLFDGKYKMLTFFNFNEMILTYDNDSYLFFNNIDE